LLGKFADAFLLKGLDKESSGIEKSDEKKGSENGADVEEEEGEQFFSMKPNVFTPPFFSI
jgi:hypothetical protein